MIISERLKQIGTIVTLPVLMLVLEAAPQAYADVSTGYAAPIIRESNSDPTPVTSFSPEVGSELTRGTSTDSTAYYGVVASPSASSSDVFWRITVSNASSTLLVGDVNITEKGF